MKDRYNRKESDIHIQKHNKGRHTSTLEEYEPDTLSKALDNLLPRMIKGIPNAKDNYLLKTNTFVLRPPEGVGEYNIQQLQHLPQIIGDLERVS